MRLAEREQNQFNLFRHAIWIVVSAILGISGGQTFAASDANRDEICSTVIKPLIIQIEFPGTWKTINTRTVKDKFIDQLDEYIRDVSHGKVCIKGEVLDKWYKLANPISAYWIPWQNLQAVRYNLRNLVSDSLAAVDNDIDVSKYDFVIIALGATFKEWGNHGVAAYPGMLGWNSDRVLMTPSGRKVNRGIVAYASTVHLGHVFHDVAHVFAGVKDGKRVLPCLYDQDLLASSTLRTGPGVLQAFTDSQINMGAWDTMSCNSCLQRPAPPGISSWTKLRLGWLEPSRVHVVNPGEEKIITLGPLEDASSHTMAIKIPVTDTTYYLVENRQYIGHDKNLPETGVLIMYADDKIAESRHGQSQVRLVNANPTVPRLESAAFDIDKNAHFVDANNGIQIKLLKKQGKSYDILVERMPR